MKKENKESEAKRYKGYVVEVYKVDVESLDNFDSANRPMLDDMLIPVFVAEEDKDKYGGILGRMFEELDKRVK